MALVGHRQVYQGSPVILVGAGDIVMQRARVGVVGTTDRSIYKKMGIARISSIKDWFTIGLLMERIFFL